MAPLPNSLIQELQSLLPDLEIVTPSSPNYEHAIQRWMRSAQKYPSAITYPTTPATISHILHFTTKHAIPLAICGGAHCIRGSSVTDGLVISLSKLTSISINPGPSPTLTASGGVLWSTLYSAAAKHSLALVGGVTPSVGIGGFTLHGGYSWLTGAHGMALDSLIEVEIVLADGRILICSEKENEDLFWALRGAGACFGVVTRFTLRAYEQRERVWSGVLVLRRGELGTVVRVCNEIMGQGEGNEGGKAAMCVLFGRLPAAAAAGEEKVKELAISCLVFYNGSEENAREFFAPLLEAKPLVDTTQMVAFKDSGVESGSAVGNHWRKVVVGGSVIAPVEEGFLGKLFGRLEELISKCEDAEMSMVGFEFHNPFAVMRVWNQDTAFASRGRYGNLMACPTWREEENDGVCWEWGRSLGRLVDEELERRKMDVGMDEVTKSSTGIYPNYNGIGKGPKVLFGPNYERLVELKKKYDPGNVFKEYIDLLEDE